MTHFTDIADIRVALKERKHPSTVSWNRLEGRPHTDNFSQALKAEVRDGLWMLARQWQMGEFEGDDAGSPVFAKVHLETTKLRKYKPLNNAVEEFTDATPLETQVEAKPVPMTVGGQPVSLDIRLLAGRHFFKLLGSSPLKNNFLTTYAVKLPDPSKVEGAPIFAHVEVWQQWAAVAGRRMDGFALFEYLVADAGHKASDGIAGAGAAEDAVGEVFKKWFQSLLFQPQGEGDAWAPERLEYQFAVSAPSNGGEKILQAEEYYQGHLDWYNFDQDKQSAQLGDTPIPADPETEGKLTGTFIPSQVSFNGSPNTRWWAFEDGKTNFGDIKPDTTDLGKLLVMEFALVYANDWYLLPVTLPAGTLSLVKGLAVTNVFGERTWVLPGNKGLDDDFRRWSMFTMNTLGKRGEPADMTLALLPTVPKIQEGQPIEEIALIRDEMANMVWGVETKILSPSGGNMNGRSAAFETRAFFEKLAGVTPVDIPDFKANIRYEVMNSVPENWIPFPPVQIDETHRSVQLQRSSMLRFILGDDERPRKIKPRTDLLREGLEKKPVEVYFINEEEVPRSGVHVTQSFQRTRWYAGKVFTWLGTRKETGRGEGSSGLAFDRVEAVRKK